MPNTDYNGLTTKVRAMKSILLTDDNFQHMLSLDSVDEVLTFLREHPKYKLIFDESYDNIAHRSQIELLLSFSYFDDYLKIYKFANGNQRQILSLLFDKFEIDILKKCLTSMHIHCSAPSLNGFTNFFNKHSLLDIDALCAASSLEEFVNILSKTRYYTLFHSLYEKGITDIYEYKIHLDIMYYKIVWKNKKKISSKTANSIFTTVTGVEIDMQNIICMYRFKKYYSVESSQIYNLIIPITYNLSKNDLSNLINSSTIDEFLTIFKTTHYGRTTFDFDNIEYSYNKILSSIYTSCTNKYPCSIAPILHFLFTRLCELDALTTVLECVRYNVKPQKISNYMITL